MINDAGAVRVRKGEVQGHTKMLMREMPLMPQ